MALADAGATASPSEAHGFAAALLAIMPEQSLATLVRELVPADPAPDGAVTALEELVTTTYESLNGTDFAFEPLLVDDAAPAPDRLQGLIDWASGFLHGLGHTGNNAKLRERLATGNLQEMTQDLLEITRAELDDSSDDEVDQSLTEVTEYLRVVTQTFFDDLAPAPESPSGSTLHDT
ncbi:MAG: UPF0149 family protein [Pseudomonadota bacterium]